MYVKSILSDNISMIPQKDKHDRRKQEPFSFISHLK